MNPKDLINQIKNHKIIVLPINEVMPYSRNPLEHPEWQLKKISDSMLKFGWSNPIIIDEKGEIIAGHGRVLAALGLGLEEVPCVVMSHLSKQDKIAYRIADNKISEMAEWNYDFLKEDLIEINFDNYDLELTGFSQEEMLEMGVYDEEQKNELDPEKEDEIPEVDGNEFGVKLGDIWQLGEDLVCEGCGYVEKL